MNLFRQTVVCSAVVLWSVAPRASAQQYEEIAFPRWAFSAALDAGALPDEFSSRCGNAGAPSVGGGIGVLFHPRQWLVLESDTRASAIPLAVGCKAIAPAPIQIGPNEWESPVARNFGHAPMPPLARTALRVGFETTNGVPVVRATVGSGLIWSKSPSPFQVATIGLGSRGRLARFYSELEWGVARTRVNDSRATYHIDSVGSPIFDTRTSSFVVLHPRWTTLHVGVELTLSSR